MAGSHYEALQVARGCSQDEIRRAYHRAARLYHPDKQSHADAASNDPVEAANEAEFLRIQEAYEVLRDPQSREAYDRQMAQEELCRQRDVEDVRIADEVPLAEMLREEFGEDDDDDIELIYSLECRCGGAYEITDEELRDGVDIVPCNGCSLNIRVLPSSA